MKTKQLNYVPLDSALFNISLTLPSDKFDISKMREWALMAFRSFLVYDNYRDKTALLEVTDHKSQFPDDILYVDFVAWKESITDSDLETIKDLLNLSSDADNPSLKYMGDPSSLVSKVVEAFYSRTTSSWRPLYLSDNPFLSSIVYTVNPIRYPGNYDYAEQEFTVDYDKCITTSFKDGFIYVAYKSILKNEKGQYLIPDITEVKMALFHFCMYMYWMTRVNSEQTIQLATRERMMHLSQYELMKNKATGILNDPDTLTMENIMNHRNRLIPREERFSTMFSNLNARENINF